MIDIVSEPSRGTVFLFNTWRPRQNGRHFADDIFKCIFVDENVWIPIKISMKFVPKGPINKISALVQIMAWYCPGDKPLSETMMVRLTTHICVTRPQWVNVFVLICTSSYMKSCLRQHFYERQESIIKRRPQDYWRNAHVQNTWKRWA